MTPCAECLQLAAVVSSRHPETLVRDGVAHELPADCADQIPLCEAVSVTTRIRAGTMEPL